MVDVSVVIPTANRPRLLARALESVAAQRFAGKYECIVIDDGTLESSGEVRSLTNRYAAHYLSTGGNAGGAVGRNLGIGRSRAALIAFLDDDDYWHTEKLEQQVACMEDTSIAMSYTGITILGKYGRTRYSFRKPRYSDQCRAQFRHSFIGTTSSVMVRRTALDAVGGFDPTLPALQDYDLYLRLLGRFRTGWIDAALTFYDDTTGDGKISASRHRFLEAVRMLSDKYRDHPHFPLLRKSFRSIFVLKCIRSRSFLFATLRSMPGWRP